MGKTLWKYLIIIIVLYSCSKQKKASHDIVDNRLKGEWYFITEDSLYNELHVYDSSLCFMFGDVSMNVILDYSIFQDSLIAFDETRVISYKIEESLSSDEIILINNEFKYELHPMEYLYRLHESKELEKELEIFRENYLYRSSLYSWKKEFNFESNQDFELFEIEPINDNDE